MDGTTTVLALSRTLRGLTPKFGRFDDSQHNELQFEQHISSQPHLTLVACRHFRRIFNAHIIGILIWNLEGEIVDANEAFLNMLGFSREDLISGRLRWPDLTPAEWRDRDERAVAEIKATGALQPFQREYLRRDGSRLPVMVSGAMFGESKNEGVAFVLDLSQQKHAEDERKRAEEALQEAQTELAHVTRVAALGELTASIAHEINQPLGAVVNNASACLRWLTANNLEEARQSVSLVIAEGHRAGKIISRVRSLAKKAPPHKDWLDINETIDEVIAMARSSAQRNRVSLQTQLAKDLPLILGDRIQLQQVILNLLINAVEAMSEVNEGQRELWVSSERLTKTGARGHTPRKPVNQRKTSSRLESLPKRRNPPIDCGARSRPRPGSKVLLVFSTPSIQPNLRAWAWG